jgi:hypothetical protein
MEKKPFSAGGVRRLRLGDAAIGGSKQYNITIAPGLLRRPCDRLGVVVDIRVVKRVVKKDDTLSLRAANAPTRYDNIRIAWGEDAPTVASTARSCRSRAARATPVSRSRRVGELSDVALPQSGLARDPGG